MLTAVLVPLVAATVAAPPIDIYDLTYALSFDAHDPVQVASAWDHAHVVATLQGNVNRDGPHLYVSFVNRHGLNIDDYWLDRLCAPGEWLHGRPRRVIPDIHALVRTYRRAIKGAVVYDPSVPATSNLASTIAGADELIAIRYDPRPGSLFTQLVKGGPRLPVVRWLIREDGSPLFAGRGTIPGTETPSTGSAKCDAYLWLRHHYIDTGKVDAAYGAFYIDAWWLRHPTLCPPNHHQLTNHDFFVARRAFFFDLNVWQDEATIDDPQQKPGTDLKTLRALLRSAYEQAGRERMIHIGGFTPWAFKYTTAGQAGGTHDPVPTEWELVRVASAYNAYLDADAIDLGAMANASFYMHFPLEDRYPQAWVTRDDLKRRGYLTDDGRVNFDGREFIIFYVGDYDSSAWLYQSIPNVWDRSDRGNVPLMWCISPIIERRAPMALHYLRRTATPNDYFATSDNGAGYLNPSMLPEPRDVSGLPSGLDAWARHSAPIYRRWGLTITGFIIDGYAPGQDDAVFDCYARFSPNGIVPQKVPATRLRDGMPIIRAGFDVQSSPDQAAAVVRERVRLRTIPFHWFRAILKRPDWYAALIERLATDDPKIELLDAPTFFELYRIWLENHPAAAAGRIESPR